jgi:hypothetical protein
MLNKPRRLTKSRLLTLMAVPFFGLSPPTQANPGLDWLAAQAQPDGQYSTANDIATPFTATAETLTLTYPFRKAYPLYYPYKLLIGELKYAKQTATTD